MVEMIGTTAKSENVQVFQRYELMRHWHVARGMPFETFISPDGLHLNDWSYNCWAKGLANAIARSGHASGLVCHRVARGALIATPPPALPTDLQ